MTDGILVAATTIAVGGLALLRWHRPAWYWMSVGVLVAAVRVRLRYASVMEACGLTVPPSRTRLALARTTRTEAPASRVPRIVAMRPTRTGLVLRIKLRPGQDAYDYLTSTDRLRHSFGMQGVSCREVKAGVVELRMTGYDVLRRVQMPARTERDVLRVPVSLREDGAVHYRDYRQVPHALNLGATQSGKSVYQRRLVTVLAPQPVTVVGIDCKNGVELGPLARRFSALAANPDDALGVLEALCARMASIYELIRREQRVSADVPEEEVTADIWGLPDHLRPVPVVVVIDEVAELALYAGKDEEKRRDRIITALVRLVQLGRAAGIYVEICGQRFGSELGKGITMLRAQLTGRVAHRVNDEASANMAFADISPDAVLATTQIPADRPGTAICGDSLWSVTEASRFLEHAVASDDPLHAAWVLALTLGLRRGEILGLTWSSVDVETGELYIDHQLQRAGKEVLHRETKTADSEDFLPLPDLALAALRARRQQQEEDRVKAGELWQDVHGLIFTTRYGTPIEPGNLTRAFAVRIRQAGVRAIPLRNTRHTTGSLLVALKVHPKVAQRILRHSKFTMTFDVYAEASDEEIREAVQRLSRGFGS